MSKIIACYKWVADETDLRINPDLSVDLSKAKGKISEYDKNAIEAAVQAAKMSGGAAVALTLGSGKAKQSIKDALSRGLEEAFWINTESYETMDGAAISKILSAAITDMEDYQLIICAEGASDTFARRIGPSIAARLDIPCISSAIAFTVEGNVIQASRKLDDSVEVVTTELPAVLCVLPKINHPPIPGLKAVLEAGKKPVREYKLDDLSLSEMDLINKTTVTSFKAFVMNRKNIVIDGDSAADKVKELVINMRKEGVI